MLISWVMLMWIWVRGLSMLSCKCRHFIFKSRNWVVFPWRRSINSCLFLRRFTLSLLFIAWFYIAACSIVCTYAYVYFVIYSIAPFNSHSLSVLTLHWCWIWLCRHHDLNGFAVTDAVQRPPAALQHPLSRIILLLCYFDQVMYDVDRTRQ